MSNPTEDQEKVGNIPKALAKRDGRGDQGGHGRNGNRAEAFGIPDGQGNDHRVGHSAPERGDEVLQPADAVALYVGNRFPQQRAQVRHDSPPAPKPIRPGMVLYPCV